MSENIKLAIVGHVTSTSDVVDNKGDNTPVLSPITPVEVLYESVQLRTKSSEQLVNGQVVTSNDDSNNGVQSIYEDLWSFSNAENGTQNPPNTGSVTTYNNDDSIYDTVESVILRSETHSAKIITVEEPASAYDEVIINDGRFIIPSSHWESDSDALESDFDDDLEAPKYFGENLEELYENLESRKLSSLRPRALSFDTVYDEKTLKSSRGILKSCIPFSRNSKSADKYLDEEDTPLYVDPNILGEKMPVMPPLSLDFSVEEAERYKIVEIIVKTEATYKECLDHLVQIEEEVRNRKLLDESSLDKIFCSIQSIYQSHEMFNLVLASRLNEWTVHGKLGDIICASFSKSTTTIAYTDFVNNFLDAIETFKSACKNCHVFHQYIQVRISTIKPDTTFHELMIKPFERFPEFIHLIQDLLEVTPVGHVDRVPLQLALTQVEVLAELINARRKESEMKCQLKYIDTQISQYSQPLCSSGRAFIRQDDMVHCLVDGVSVVGTKKLRLILLSDMLLCLTPIGKKKRIMSGRINSSKNAYKLKWNVPLSDIQFVEYGTGVDVAAGKYGTTTTYSDQGKYRQASAKIQNQIENLQHDLAIIGQIAGLASSLKGKHQLLDHEKVERWYKSVQNSIAEELKTINMFWLELSLPTKSGQQNYVFNLPSPSLKEEWEDDAMNAKLALESRNNPGWYLPENDITCGLSILRRNMPLLAEFYDLFNLNSKSRVEHMITFPVDTSPLITGIPRGLDHFVWISARGELQGHVSVVRFERKNYTPSYVESFNACSGIVYSIAYIPAMNTRSDQTIDKYNTKYGFPFPTIWLGSQSSKIYIYNADCDDRSKPLMELKMRDAPLIMKYAMKKIYVGLANGTLAIFRSNTSDHWNLVQPSILPLGRYPVAIIADVKDKLWCGSGSQIYVVSKRGDRIQRIIAVDTNMKNLVKHIVTYGVGVWVSVWKKPTIRLYHAETCDMLQEVNVISPITKMRNDVDSQVQYISMEKISVTALLCIPGFLWVGTSVGLILVFPLPKMQGVPRVIGRACVSFHAHCGPVRSLLAMPQGMVENETKIKDVISEEEDPKEVDRKFSMLADSEESVESDEEFYFVDDKNIQSTKEVKKPNANTNRKRESPKLTLPDKNTTEGISGTDDKDSENFTITKPNDFAKIMSSFDGFNNNLQTKDKSNTVRSYTNRLFSVSSGNQVENVKHHEESREDKNSLIPKKPSNKNQNNDCEELNVIVGTDLASVPEPDVIYENLKRDNLVVDYQNERDASKNEISVDNFDHLGINDEVASNSFEDHIYVNYPVGKDNPDCNEFLEKREIAQEDNGTSKLDKLKKDSQNSSSENAYDEQRRQHIQSGGLNTEEVSYITVLSQSEKQSEGASSKNANDISMESEVRKEMENQLPNPRNSRRRCLSHLVVSVGEGHVDLRLKVKSKQEVKKVGPSIFLIWRVNGKV